MKISISLFLLLICLKYSKGCFVPGKCSKSTLIDFVLVNDEIECGSSCQSNENCKWISYNQITKICHLYNSCNEYLSEELNFLSGDLRCLNKDLSFKSEKCLGEEIDILEMGDVDSCLSICLNTKNCFYFTYKSGLCALLQTCEKSDKSCLDCISGSQHSVSKELNEIENTLGKSHHLMAKKIVDYHLMVIGGSIEPKDSVDLINFNSQTTTTTTTTPCEMNTPIYFSHKLHGAVYTQEITNTKMNTQIEIPMICGGPYYQKDCFKYEFVNGTFEEFDWITYENSFNFLLDSDIGSIHVPNIGLWLVGFGKSYILDPITMELKRGPDTNNDLSKSCLLQVNATHTMIIGGFDSPNGVAYFNWAELIWEKGPDLKISRRFGHSCGLYRQSYVIVAGGDLIDDKTEIWDPSTNQWYISNSLPLPIHNSKMIHFKDRLFMVGGYRNLIAYKNIFEFVGNEWKKLELTLSKARSNHLAMFIPSSILKCSKN